MAKFRRWFYEMQCSKNSYGKVSFLLVCRRSISPLSLKVPRTFFIRSWTSKENEQKKKTNLPTPDPTARTHPACRFTCLWHGRQAPFDQREELFDFHIIVIPFLVLNLFQYSTESIYLQWIPDFSGMTNFVLIGVPREGAFNCVLHDTG